MAGPTALLDAWKRTGTSGPGVDILESRSSYLVFLAERRYKKNKNPKTIIYRKMDEEIQRQLRISRRDEWSKWEKFNAAIAIPRAEREKLMAEGHQLIPTQWIETDKNDHRRREGGPDVPALYKAASLFVATWRTTLVSGQTRLRVS